MGKKSKRGTKSKDNNRKRPSRSRSKSQEKTPPVAAKVEEETAANVSSPPRRSTTAPSSSSSAAATVRSPDSVLTVSAAAAIDDDDDKLTSSAVIKVVGNGEIVTEEETRPQPSSPDAAATSEAAAVTVVAVDSSSGGGRREKAFISTHENEEEACNSVTESLIEDRQSNANEGGLAVASTVAALSDDVDNEDWEKVQRKIGSGGKTEKLAGPNNTTTTSIETLQPPPPPPSYATTAAVVAVEACESGGYAGEEADEREEEAVITPASRQVEKEEKPNSISECPTAAPVDTHLLPDDAKDRGPALVLEKQTADVNGSLSPPEPPKSDTKEPPSSSLSAIEAAERRKTVTVESNGSPAAAAKGENSSNDRAPGALDPSCVGDEEEVRQPLKTGTEEETSNGEDSRTKTLPLADGNIEGATRNGAGTATTLSPACGGIGRDTIATTTTTTTTSAATVTKTTKTATKTTTTTPAVLSKTSGGGNEDKAGRVAVAAKKEWLQSAFSSKNKSQKNPSVQRESLRGLEGKVKTHREWLQHAFVDEDDRQCYIEFKKSRATAATPSSSSSRPPPPQPSAAAAAAAADRPCKLRESLPDMQGRVETQREWLLRVFEDEAERQRYIDFKKSRAEAAAASASAASPSKTPTVKGLVAVDSEPVATATAGSPAATIPAVIAAAACSFASDGGKSDNGEDDDNDDEGKRPDRRRHVDSSEQDYAAASDFSSPSEKRLPSPGSLATVTTDGEGRTASPSGGGGAGAGAAAADHGELNETTQAVFVAEAREGIEKDELSRKDNSIPIERGTTPVGVEKGQQQQRVASWEGGEGKLSKPESKAEEEERPRAAAAAASEEQTMLATAPAMGADSRQDPKEDEVRTASSAAAGSSRPAVAVRGRAVTRVAKRVLAKVPLTRKTLPKAEDILKTVSVRGVVVSVVGAACLYFALGPFSSKGRGGRRV